MPAVNFQQNIYVVLEDVPLDLIHCGVWFMHEGAPLSRFCETARTILNQWSPNGKWTGRGGEISCPVSSPDLDPLDF